MSRLMTKPIKWHVRPATTQISLGIRPVWSESSLSAWRKLWSLAAHWVLSEDSDQTERILGTHTILLVLSWGGSTESIMNNDSSQHLDLSTPHSSFCDYTCCICQTAHGVAIVLKAYSNKLFSTCQWYDLGRDKRIWYLSPMRAAKVQASLRIRAVSPEPSLLAHTSSESRGTFKQKARSLAPLDGWACAVKVCHDGMLADTNSLDGAQFLMFRTAYLL